MTLTSVQEYKYLINKVKKLKDLQFPQEAMDTLLQRIKRLEYVLPDSCKEDKIFYLRTVALDDSNITFITERYDKSNVFVVDGLFKGNGQPSGLKINLNSLPVIIAKLLMSDKIEQGWKLWRGKVHNRIDSVKKYKKSRISQDKKNPNVRYLYKRDIIENFRDAFDLLDDVRIDLVQVCEIL